jgi:hypothetical protein
MTVKTLYYNGKNRDQVNMTIANLDPTALHRIRIDLFDEKTREQEEKYHAMLGDIAEQMQHLTLTLDLDSWKRLCVAQFKADSIENDVPRLAEYWKAKQMRLMPSLDGKTLVALGDQTRDFPKYVAAGFIEWLNAYGANNGVKFKARDEH